MNDSVILDYINSVIEDEEGNSSTVDTLLVNTGLDSFGITMVLVTLDDKYNLWTTYELENMEFEDLTLGVLVDLIRGSNDSK